MVVSKTSLCRENAVVALGITKGARVILSTPPAKIISASPDLIVLAAQIIESIPDPHNLFIVTPGTSIGKPANKDAIRAIFRLSSPA